MKADIMRVFELAKELSIKVKEFLERAHKEGYASLKGNFAKIDAGTEAALRQLFAPKHVPPRVRLKMGTKEYVPGRVVAHVPEPPPQVEKPAPPPVRDRKPYVPPVPLQKAEVGQLIKAAPEKPAHHAPATRTVAGIPAPLIRTRPPIGVHPVGAAPHAVETPAARKAGHAEPHAGAARVAAEPERKPAAAPSRGARKAAPETVRPRKSEKKARGRMGLAPAEAAALLEKTLQLAPAAEGEKETPPPAETKPPVAPAASTVEIIAAPAHEPVQVAPEREVRALRPHEVEFFSRFSAEESKDRRRTKGAFPPARGHVEEKQPAKVFKKHKEDPKLVRRAFIERLSRTRKKPAAAKTPSIKLEVCVPVSVRDLSQAMGVKTASLIHKLIDGGTMAAINTMLDEEQTVLLGLEFGREIEVKKRETLEAKLARIAAPAVGDKLQPRAPIVTMMGHVDHGKTSLLDRIRHADVAAHESGGITQHIGAYKVELGARKVVFLDTPGHEAFSRMRARGANCTDVVVLVVAADDGVMPQTEEAIVHAKAANVSIVVALNKMDKKEANPHKVKQQLSGFGLLAEDWGGKTGMVPVSAVTGAGIEDLIERISLEAEILDLKADPSRSARAAILEAHLDEGRGIVATVLVRDGVMRLGDAIWCGKTYGKVRAMYDDKGKRASVAGPSTPVLVTGLVSLPEAGDEVLVVEDSQVARELAEAKIAAGGGVVSVARQHVTLENLFANLGPGKVKEAKIVLKTDVGGSLEALRSSLDVLSTSEVKVHVVHAAVGAVNESDVTLADVSDALVIGFRVPVEERAADLASQRKVDIRTYDVIYRLIEDMSAALEGLLEPERVEVHTGTVSVKEVFRITRVGSVAGCMVTDGKVERSAQIRLFRNGEKMFEGKLESLKRFKDDVKEVSAGLECGLRLAGFDNIQAGDTIQAFQIQQIARKLRS
ncbi:MAG: translation initiation factor IF-2 [Planctomycetota bacterium]|nr:translation initiation factor IF-2 [Planctomycetota bacterium]